MADITALQAEIRGETPPAEPFDFRKARQRAAQAKHAEREEITQTPEVPTADRTAEDTEADNGKNSTGA